MTHVFRHAFIAHLAEAELSFHHPEHVLHVGSHFGFAAVVRALDIAELGVATAFFVRQVLGCRCARLNRLGVPRVGRISPHAGLATVKQQLADHLRIMHIGRCRLDRMNQLCIAVHPDMRLHSEVPLIAFARRMHLRVAAFRLVLGRTRRTDDGRIHDRASLDLAPVPRQVGVDAFKNLAAQSVRLQKMPELAHRGLVRSPLAPQVNARELAHRRNVIQRLLDRRVRKPIPVLEGSKSEAFVQCPPDGVLRPAVPDNGVGSGPPAPAMEPLALFRPETVACGSSCGISQNLEKRGSAGACGAISSIGLNFFDDD